MPVFCRAVAAALTLGILFAQEPPPFRSEVNLVDITAVVRSQQGVLIGDLHKEDFEVLEDGVLQKMQFFARQTELPLSLGLIVDVSGSQEHFLKQHNRDIQTFLQEVLRPSDKTFAVCFGNHFYDALYFSAIGKMNKANEQRRALLVFSDGEENSSEHDQLDAIEAAQNTNTLVYCIRYTHKEHGHLNARNKYGIRVMKHVASLTGAADFDGTEEDLKDVFAAIGQELRSMYEIAYVSTNRERDGSFRKLTIRCKRAGSVVRAKSGYYGR